MSAVQDPLFVTLYAQFERSALNGSLAGIALGKDKIRPLLDLDPVDSNKRCRELARAAQVLPQGVINPAHRVRYASQRWDGQVVFTEQVATGLEEDTTLAQEVQVDPAYLRDLCDKKRVYKSFVFFGQRLKDQGMDQRLT